MVIASYPGWGVGTLPHPDLMNEWLEQPLSFDTRVGGEIVVDHNTGYLCRSELISLSHNGAELSWEFPDEPTSRLSLCTFDTNDHTGHHRTTVLKLEHFDLGDLIDSSANGWLTHLTYLEASLSGTPLPANRFWSLCATFAQLREPTKNGVQTGVQ